MSSDQPSFSVVAPTSIESIPLLYVTKSQMESFFTVALIDFDVAVVESLHMYHAAVFYCNSYPKQMASVLCGTSPCSARNRTQCYLCKEKYTNRKSNFDGVTGDLLVFNVTAVTPPFPLPPQPPRLGSWKGWAYVEDSPGKIGLIPSENHGDEIDPLAFIFQDHVATQIFIEVWLLHSYVQMGSVRAELLVQPDSSLHSNASKVVMSAVWDTRWEDKVSLTQTKYLTSEKLIASPHYYVLRLTPIRSEKDPDRVGNKIKLEKVLITVIK